MKAPGPEGRIDVSTEELEALLEQVKQEPLREEGYHKLKAAIRTLGYVTELLEKKETTLTALRELLCSASTEKTDKVLKQAGINTGEKKPESLSKKPKRTAGGHGRNSAAAYSGAQKVKVPHASLKPGDACPDGCGGKVYPQREPGVLVRIKGQAPLAATVYELEKLRCNLCGNVYTAEAPADAREKKYDESAAAMIALLRYGSGVPWNRTEGLEANLGIPLPAATQCEIMVQTAIPLQPALEELKRQAAQAEVVHNDDTSMRVLSLDRDADISPERTGDAEAREQGMSAEQRLAFHQEHSKPVMDKLHAWLGAQFDERLVEPNSGLGQAISYLLNHWQKLTLFLEKAGVPLDNNIVERALKKAILHRKNSLFYKTRKGAQMGDLFMSLIHTCELNEVNAFDYLTELLRHVEELKRNPSAWMPWSYRDTLARLATPAAA